MPSNCFQIVSNLKRLLEAICRVLPLNTETIKWAFSSKIINGNASISFRAVIEIVENPQVEISCGNEAFKSINFSACFKVNSNRKLEKGRKLNKFNPMTNLTGIKFTVKETAGPCGGKKWVKLWWLRRRKNEIFSQINFPLTERKIFF